MPFCLVLVPTRATSVLGAPTRLLSYPSNGPLWVDGIVFEGHFRDNVAEGHGTYSWPDGARYEGQIRRGLRHGRGVMRFADAPTWYDGEWRMPSRHGRGSAAGYPFVGYPFAQSEAVPQAANLPITTT